MSAEDRRAKGEPHYFVASVRTRLGKPDIDRLCAVCDKPREHRWHLQRPRGRAAKAA